MRTPVIASTQYGDFNGTSSLDLAEGAGALLWTLAHRVKIPGGYRPVGFGVTAEGIGSPPEHGWHLTVYSIDERLLEGSKPGRELSQFARNNPDGFPVIETSASIEPADLVELLLTNMKRLDLIFATKQLEDRLMLRGTDEPPTLRVSDN